MDHWLSFADRPNLDSDFDALAYLNQALAPRTWLVAKHLTIADFCVFSRTSTFDVYEYPNIARWHKQLLSLPEVLKVLKMVENYGTGGSRPIVKQKTPSKNQSNKTPAAASANSGFVICLELLGIYYILQNLIRAYNFQNSVKVKKPFLFFYFLQVGFNDCFLGKVQSFN